MDWGYFDMQGIIEIIKRAATEAIEEGAPAGVFFGTVYSAEPVMIELEQKLMLEEKNMVFIHGTGALEAGDRVVLLRAQGGQLFVVLGKLLK